MKSLIVIFVILIFACSLEMGFAQTSKNHPNLEISVSAMDMPLKDILKDFTKNTGWTVGIDVKLAGTDVSGSFDKENIDSFLKKALKGQSTIVLFDEENKHIDIRSFGKKGQRRIKISNVGIEGPPSYEELNELLDKHSTARKVFEKHYGDSNSVEPMTGKTLKEIDTMQAREREDFEEYSKNPNSVEPMTGMTLGNIAALRAQAENLARNSTSSEKHTYIPTQ